MCSLDFPSLLLKCMKPHIPRVQTELGLHLSVLKSFIYVCVCVYIYIYIYDGWSVVVFNVTLTCPAESRTLQRSVCKHFSIIRDFYLGKAAPLLIHLVLCCNVFRSYLASWSFLFLQQSIFSFFFFFLYKINKICHPLLDFGFRHLIKHIVCQETAPTGFFPLFARFVHSGLP